MVAARNVFIARISEFLGHILDVIAGFHDDRTGHGQSIGQTKIIERADRIDIGGVYKEFNGCAGF